MEDVLNHIMILLYKKNPDSPFNWSAADLYVEKDKNSKFKDKVKEYIKEQANINDYENLNKQNIRLIDNCNCNWCTKIFNSRD